MPKNTKKERLLYRRARAAEILDCSVSLLKRLEREGVLTPVRPGGRDVFYPVEQIHGLAKGEGN